MHIAIAVAAAGLFILFPRFAHAANCGGAGEEGDNFQYKRLLKCPTRTAFCHALGYTPEPTTTSTVTPITYYTGPEIAPYTFTKVLYNTTSTVTTTNPTSTLTIGKSTTTISVCRNAVTCAAETFYYYQGSNEGLGEACYCALQTTLRTTISSTATISVEIVPTTTITESRTIKTATATKTRTRHVAVATEAICKTLPQLTKKCHNTGVQWAEYPILDRDVRGDASTLANWDPAVYKSRAPNITGTTDVIGAIIGDYYGYTEFIYGHEVFPAYITVIHQGYLYATQNGTYHFDIPVADTTALIWVGELAYSGWNRSNALGQSAHVHLEAGKYHPFRLAWGLGKPTSYPGYYPICAYHEIACSGFYFHLVAPDTSTIYGETNSHGYPLYDTADGYYYYSERYYSPDIVQFSCDGTSAPKFPPYGKKKTRGGGRV